MSVFPEPSHRFPPILTLRKPWLSTPIPNVFPYEQTFVVAGKVWLGLIEVPWKVKIDRLAYLVGGTSAGNVRLGLYAEGPTFGSPTGGRLMVQTGSAAQPAANGWQFFDIAETTLEPGRYYGGIQSDGTTGTFKGCRMWSSVVSDILCWFFDNPGGYGAFPSTCPTVTQHTDYNVPPYIILRVKEDLV